MTLTFRPGMLREGKATYRKSDYALAYEVEQTPSVPGRQDDIEVALGIKKRGWFAIADSLALVFSAEAEFVAFEAYTNSERWISVTELVLPVVTGLGVAFFADPPHDSDRVDLGVVPKYYHSSEQSHLRIELRPAPTSHYQISSCLVIGLDRDGLASLDVTDLRIE